MFTEAITAAKAAFDIEADAIRRIPDSMDFDAFNRVVEALSKAERIAASGCGHSGIAC